MAISNTYQFGTNTTNDDLINDAFQRIGRIRNEITPLDLKAAIMSANLDLTSWQGKVPLSWCRKRQLISLNVGQLSYNLPRTITRVVDVCATQPQRLNTGGTAFAVPDGNAANCFNPNSSAGCDQTGINGDIGYDYGASNPQCIQYIGINPLVDQVSYKLNIEYSFDMNNWQTALATPATTYYAGQITWFVVENSVSARAWRIKETGGSALKINQLYFSVPSSIGPGDRYLMGISYTEWMQIPTKTSSGFPSSYFFNAQINPYIILWPVLSQAAAASQFTGLLYTAYMYMADLGNLYDQPDIPQRFYEALTAALAARLAQKFAPDRFEALHSYAKSVFQLATLTDYEDVPLRIQPAYSAYT